MNTPAESSQGGVGRVLIVLLVIGLAVWGVFGLAGAIVRARDEARMLSSRSNLKQLGIAFHNFHDTQGVLPTGLVQDRWIDGRHSWMTYLIPFVEASRLYESIDQKSAWDSPRNAEPFSTVFPAYMNPGVDSPDRTANGYGITHYSVNSNLYSRTKPIAFQDVEGGTAHTLMLGEVNTNFVAWADPDNKRDPSRGLNTVPVGFGSPYRQGTQFTLCDGSLRTLSDDIDPVVLRQLADPKARPDGEW